MANKSKDKKQDDQSLEEYLQGDSALSRAYGVEEKVQVPAHIDKAILSAANEAVKSEQVSKVAYSPFARNWYVPASMAAVLMLCVGLVFTIYQDSGQTLLTAPKSEYDIDAQTTPMKSEESRVSGEKNRQYKDAEEMLDEAEISVDAISEQNRPATSPIESFEKKKSEVQEKPASRGLLREKATEMDDALLPEASLEAGSGIASGITGKVDAKKDASKQTLSDSPQISGRRDNSGRLEAADVKRQKQLDVDDLNNKLGGMESKATEQGLDTGTSSSSVQEPRYRQVEEYLPKQNEILNDEFLNKETLDTDIGTKGFDRSVKSLGDEMMTPEQWLEQINDSWVSGDHEGAKESLNQFFTAYPDYPIDKMKTILDPQIELMEYAR